MTTDTADKPRRLSTALTWILVEKWSPLVTAITFDTMGVADECLSRGLVSGEFYDKMANDERRNGNSKSVARNLLGEVKKAIELDDERYDKFVHILEGKMPAGREEKIVKVLKEEGRRVQSAFNTKSVGIKSVVGNSAECKATCGDKDQQGQENMANDNIIHGDGDNRSMADSEVNIKFNNTTDNVANEMNKPNRTIAKQLYYVYKVKELRGEDLGGKNIIVLVPVNYVQWQTNDTLLIHPIYWLQWLIAFFFQVIIGLAVGIVLSISIHLVVFIVLVIGLFVYYKVSTQKEKLKAWYGTVYV